MKVLITGGTGVISSGLVEECVARGFDTFAITRGNNNFRNIKGATYIHCNAMDKQDVSNAINGNIFDIVVECLAYNIDELRISLENYSNRCRQYVFISTAGVYGRHLGRVKESDEKNLISWDYSRNKIECEKYLKEYCTNNKLIYTIVRPTVTYGNYRIPYPVTTRKPGWTHFQRILDGKPILGSTNSLFSIIHIEDFSKMVVSLFDNDKAYCQDFHIASKKCDIQWDDVMHEVSKILCVPVHIIHVQADDYKKYFGSIYEELIYNKNPQLLLDDEKIRDTTSCEATIDLNEGMRRTVSAMKEEFDRYSLCLDNEWNDYCDATIYYAFQKGRLSDSEMDYLKQYYTKDRIKKIKKCKGRVTIRIAKKKIRSILGRIKRMVLKRINKV